MACDAKIAASANGNGTKAERLSSIDALRGFAMLMIIGVDAVVIALGKCLFGGDGGWLAGQMTHPEWFGLTFYDTIFPTFLFVSGLSFPFSFARQNERGTPRSRILLQCLRRALVLVALGWVVNVATCGWPGFADFRYGSVLAKIGLGWFFAAVCFVCLPWTARIASCAALLVGYAVLLNVLTAPDYPSASSFSIEGNFIGWLDRMTMPGRLWQGTVIDGKYVGSLCEPSGLYMNFFAAATAMLGMFVGEFVRTSRCSGAGKALRLAGLAGGLVASGLVMSLFVPVSKKLWTPSFSLVVGGYSTAMFALFYYLVEVRQWRAWAFPLIVVGLNSVTIYVLKSFAEYDVVQKWVFGEAAAAGLDLLLACCYLIVCWSVTYVMWRRRWFLKV